MSSNRGEAGGPGQDDKAPRAANQAEEASAQTPGDQTHGEAPEHGEFIQPSPRQAAEETANPSPETAAQAGPAEREEVQRETRSAERQAEPAPPPFARARSLPIVAVGASAGGLEALQAFFAQVPEDSGIGFVVITHVRPQRESLLPELLASATKLQVVAGENQVRVEPDHIVVAKDSLLGIHNGVLTYLDADRDPGTKHHPIDHFFRDLARDQGEQAIGVVLSGSGNDGTLGAKAIKAAGGMVMAQRPGSAKYASMPSSVIDTGVADYVMPAEDLPPALVAYCHGPFLRLGDGQRTPLLPEDTVRTILLRLRARTGQDFTCYKRSTVSRRIQRRMNVHQIEEPQDYLRYLQTQSAELDLLLQDLLISVTSFFRDAEAFAALAERGLPRLLSERKDGELLRVWVAGCATGEEAYSVAILLDAAVREAGRVHEVQLFATDLDAQAIDIARHGLYPEGIAADVPPERLRQYFTPEHSAYRIRKSIRDTIVFAVQNVVSDPPFTRMDLVVCRNLLIYLDNEGQQRVLPTLHYALRPGGLLFIGSSESVGAAADLFEVIDGKHKVLRRRDVPRTLPARRPAPPGPGPAHPPPPAGPVEGRALARAVEHLLLQRFAPCSLLVNENGVIVYLHGRCGLYLEPEQGRPRNNLLDMVRQGGARPLAAALTRALRERREVVTSDVHIATNGASVSANISVIPMTAPAVLRDLLLVTIAPSARPAPVPGKPHPVLAPGDGASCEELEQELRFTRESLSTTIEELQTANEELKSSNEELQSTNEELHSSNEELETSREEMQSLNEELNTVNTELQSKVEALTRVNDDMRNLLNSIQVATIFLDDQLRVKRYTEQARHLVRLIESDIGRPLSDLTSSLRYERLIEDCRRVLETLVPIEQEVQDTEGHWYLVRLLPYRRADNVIAGLVMTVLDIDRTKQAERHAQAGLDYFQSIVHTAREPLLMLGEGLRVVEANDSFYRTFEVQPKQVEGRLVYELGNRQWDNPGLRELLERILPEQSVIADYRIEHDFPNIGRRVFVLNARRRPPLAGGAALIIVAFEDVTPRAP